VILNSLMIMSHGNMYYHFDIVDACLSVGLILANLLDDRRRQMVMVMPMSPSVKEWAVQRLNGG
jgi:hypothetical protein